METSERYKEWVANAWTHYAQAKQEAHKELDEYLLKFASGAFALSLTPTIPVFQWSGRTAKELLFLAWLAFGITIGATLMSFFSSAKACERQIAISYALMLEEKKLEEIGPNRPLEMTRRLNAVSISTFLVGIVLFALYLSINF